MLRRLNLELAEREACRATTYVNWVRETIVKEVLAQRPGMEPATVPPERRARDRGHHRELARPRSASPASTSSATSRTCESVWPDDDETWTDPDQRRPGGRRRGGDPGPGPRARRARASPSPTDPGRCPGWRAACAADRPHADPRRVLRAGRRGVGRHLRAGGTTDLVGLARHPDLAARPGADGRAPPRRGPPRAGPPDQPRAPDGRTLRGLADRVLVDRGARVAACRRAPPLAAAPRRFGTPPMRPGPAAGGGADPARRGCPRAPAARRTPLDPGGSGRAVAAARGGVASACTARRARSPPSARACSPRAWSRPTGARRTSSSPDRSPVMMAEQWAASVRDGGILKWSTAVAPRRGRRPAPARRSTWPTSRTRLPGPATRPVHVVVAGGAEQAAALAAAVLRCPPGRDPGAAATPPCPTCCAG